MGLIYRGTDRKCIVKRKKDTFKKKNYNHLPKTSILFFFHRDTGSSFLDVLKKKNFFK
jgi:hypothetical protein